MKDFLSRFNHPLLRGGVVNVGAGLLLACLVGIIVRGYAYPYLVLGVVGIVIMFTATYEGKK